jgi:hypothetical protein
MADLAQVDDLTDVWRDLDAAEVGRAASLIRFASAYVRDEIPSVDARIASGTLQADTVAGIVVSMVQRAMGNTDGVLTRSRSIDDYSESFTYDRAVSSGELMLTDSERARLTGRGRAGSATNGAPYLYSAPAGCAL